MMKSWFAFGFVAAFGLMSVVGCTTDAIDSASTTDEAQQELYAEYKSGDASLSILAAGDWASTDVDVLLSYRRGTEDERALVVNFQHWKASGDPAVSEFISAMDPALTAAALSALHHAHVEGEDSNQDVFRHIQARLLTSLQSQTPAASELTVQMEPSDEDKQCYCNSCHGHHALPCN